MVPSATALKNSQWEQKHTQRAREGTDKGISIAGGTEELWNEQWNRQSLCSRLRDDWVSIRQKSVHLWTAWRNWKGKKLCTTFTTRHQMKHTGDVSKPRRFFTQGTPRVWILHQMLEMSAVCNGQKSNHTGWSEKSPARAAQQLSPLMLELPGLQTTPGWERSGRSLGCRSLLRRIS